MDKNIYCIQGRTGTGKTVLINLIASTFFRYDYEDFVLLNMNELENIACPLADEKELKKARYLIIDELIGFSAKKHLNQLIDIILFRNKKGRKTIFSTNINLFDWIRYIDENRLRMLKESLILLDMEIALEMTNRKSK